MQSLPPAHLVTLIAHLIEPDHLASMFAALQYAIDSDPNQRSTVREYLTALKSMKRYAVTIMMLSEKERAIAKSLWDDSA